MLFRDLVASFHSYNLANRRPRTADFYQSHLAKFVRLYGELPAAELRPFHCLKLRATWHLVLCLQRLYRWAVDEQELLESNPLKKLRRPRLGARRRVMTRIELARILRGARGDFRRYLLFARETAARPQELTELQWSDLRWDGGDGQLRDSLRKGRAYFLLSEYKGRSRRTDGTAPRLIPVSPRLGRLLWRLFAAGLAGGRVLSTDAGQAWQRNNVRMRFRRLWARVKVARVMQGERLSAYSFRHTAATSWAAGRMQTSVIQGWLGHSNIRTTQRYLHLQRGQMLDAWRDFLERERRERKAGGSDN